MDVAIVWSVMCHLPTRFVRARHARSAFNLHVRLVRARDLPSVTAFARRLAPAWRGRAWGRREDGKRHTDLIIGAWSDRELSGFVWCELDARPRLLALLVPPGPQQGRLERWLLRRILQTLRTLNAGSLDVSSPHGSESLVDIADSDAPLPCGCDRFIGRHRVAP